MENGFSFSSKLQFEKQMQEMSDRDLMEATARMLYDHCNDEKDLAKEVSKNKRRSWTNRIALLILVALLIALGIMDSVTALHIFGV